MDNEMTLHAPGHPPPFPEPSPLHRAVGASALGNAVEWFDYGIYAYGLTYISAALFPGDTEEDCLATIEYAKRLNPTFAQFSLFTPYPGTPVFDSFKGRILADRYENFDQYQLVFKHDRIARERARSLLSLAYSRYYFRPRWLWSFLRARFFSRKKS